jgi:hypothetical protein
LNLPLQPDLTCLYSVIFRDFKVLSWKKAKTKCLEFE